MNIRIVIADDHPIVRTSIRLEIERIQGACIIGEAGTPGALMALLKESPCDLVITDFWMPDPSIEDGLSLLDGIRGLRPNVNIIVLTMLSNSALLRAIQERAIHGIVSKSDAIAELQNAVRAVMSGELYVSATTRELLTGANKKNPHSQTATLSSREAEVLRMFVSGLTISEIAEKRGRSVKTISHQKISGMSKLGLKNDPELYVYAHEHGLFN